MKKKKVYVTPVSEVVLLETESCLASSRPTDVTTPAWTLQDNDETDDWSGSGQQKKGTAGGGAKKLWN